MYKLEIRIITPDDKVLNVRGSVSPEADAELLQYHLGNLAEEARGALQEKGYLK